MVKLFNRNKSLEENLAEYRDFFKKHPMVSGLIFPVIIAIISWSVYSTHKGWRVDELEEATESLEKEIQKKDMEIQRLETLLTPFRTIAIERYTGSEAEALSKLADRIQELESTLIALRDYSEVARLGFLGAPFSAGPGIKISGPIPKMLEGTFTERNGKYYPLCGPETEAKYREVIEKYPKFPFTYYSLAVCLHSRGDETWRAYARNANEILEKTTIINGHNEGHDQAMEELLKLLNE